MIDSRLGIQQRVFAAYRQPFFEKLAAECAQGFSLFAGSARDDEHIPAADSLQHGTYIKARNRHLFSGGMYLCWQSGLVDWVNSFRPHILIVEANPRYINLVQGINAVHAHGGKVIGWGLGSPEVRGLSGLLVNLLRQRLYSNLDAMITYSQKGADEYRAAGFSPKRVFVAPNAAVDRQDFPIPERPGGYYLGQPTVLFVGRLQERKRVDLLIQACSRLQSGIKPRLWIVGEGPERQALETQAQSTAADVTFFGSKFGDELAYLFKQADLFVLPGTGGLALQQAMSYGLPVIAAEADGTQLELVRDSNGWLMPPGNLDVLTSLISEALSEVASLRARGVESYRIVQDEINLSHMVAVFSEAAAAVKAGI